jgi:hypothetical protein
MKRSLSQRIAAAIADCKEASNRLDPNPDLPSIILSLEQMQKNLNSDQHRRSKMAAGLGRLVMEDSSFSESTLGGLLLKLADDFADEAAHL